MSIASEITRINNNIASAYTACNGKGATMPATQNSANLATCIGSIQTGSTPTLTTKTITQNGTYNASSDNADGYSSVTVNVSGGGGGGASYTGSLSLDNISNYILKASNGVLTIESWKDSSETLYSVNETILLEDNIFEESYADDTSIVYACLKNTSINPNGATYNCFFDTFSDCTNLEKVDISLEYAGSGCFFNTFFACSKLKSVTFFGLQQVKNSYRTFLNAFSNSGIENIYFPSLVEDFLVGTGNRCFQYMLEDVDGCTVHFPSNLQAVLEDYPTVLDGFGGTNTTVLFDLPATT